MTKSAPLSVKTFYASPSRNGLGIFAMLAAFLMGWFFIKVVPAGSKGGDVSVDVGVWLGWFFVIMGVIVFPVAILNMIYRFPRIVLHPGGLEFMAPFVLFRKKIEYKWKDVGPFVVGEFQQTAFSTMYMACAFTDEHHDLLVSRNDNATPNFFHADIKISAQPFSFGQTREGTKAFTDELNRWREKFGAPEITTPGLMTDDYYVQFKAKNRRAMRNAWLWALLAPFVFFLSMSVYSIRTLLF